jgi:flagellar basal-body rod protein FlgC
MSMFSAIGIAQSGITTYKTWIDATADNVSNANTAKRSDQPAFQVRRIVVQPVEGGGVQVARAAFGDPTGRLVHDPANPLADEDGMVKMPDMNLSDEMTSLIIAQRAYQANVTAFERARDGYLRELEIGK